MKQVTNENQKTEGNDTLQVFSTLTTLPASYLVSLLKSRHDAGGGSSSIMSILVNKFASTYARQKLY